MRTLRRLLEGFTIVLLGLILLGNTLGYLPWSVSTTFLTLLSLWPVLLVTAGLDIIGRGLRTPAIRVLSSALGLVALIYGGIILPASDISPFRIGFFNLGTAASSNPFDFQQPRMIATDGRILIKGGAGEIHVGAGEASVLARASGESPFQDPELTVTRTGHDANLVASMGSGAVVWPVTGESRMDVQISPRVRWDIQLQTGASSLNADLRRIPVEAFLLKTGASDSQIILGDVPKGTNEAVIRTESGVSAVTLKIPRGVEARVEAETGLSSVDVPSDFDRVPTDGRVYESKGYREADSHYLIRVQTGLGSVSIKRY
jgi:hypothetical protein